MEPGFSVEQLAENIFVPEAFATGVYYACWDQVDHNCEAFLVTGDWMWICVYWEGVTCEND